MKLGKIIISRLIFPQKTSNTPVYFIDQNGTQNRWEYYGSNADHGWGAWGTLTGWNQSFITTTLAIKLENTCYWDMTQESGVGEGIDEVWSQMLPGVGH